MTSMEDAYEPIAEEVDGLLAPFNPPHDNFPVRIRESEFAGRQCYELLVDITLWCTRLTRPMGLTATS